MERYTKVMVDKYRLHEESLRDKPLYAHLLLEISIRAKRSFWSDLEWREQGEFYLSETEYAKFKLKSTEKWKISRAIKKFIEIDFIEKVEWKTGSKWGHVYRVLDWCPFVPSFQNSEQNNEWTVNWQRTSRDEISKKKYPSKKISKMNFEEQVQAYDGSRHDEFIHVLGEEQTSLIKTARLTKYK